MTMKIYFMCLYFNRYAELLICASNYQYILDTTLYTSLSIIGQALWPRNQCTALANHFIVGE